MSWWNACPRWCARCGPRDDCRGVSHLRHWFKHNGERLAIVIATRPVDFRRGHDGLAGTVQNELGLDPHSGLGVILRSKRGDRLRRDDSHCDLRHVLQGLLRLFDYEGACRSPSISARFQTCHQRW